ncbi:hypothetical protein [Streptomyces sp. GESEQ-4]|uniref:DUF7144 family membrane protein n=1 Tax=Streptomyces sp. GESEQ-4 TaxID=2812655 RepID=UPI001FF0BCB0|nr:hypothetical protein [Streptomyces sp. GESEQ-4]
MAQSTGGVRKSQRGAELLGGGLALFAGWALELSGTLSVLLGVVGVTRDTLFSSPDYTYEFSLTAWGWIHIVIGIGLVAAGLGVLLGKAWGTGAGAVLAAVSLITQFMFIPFYPLWSISVMTLDLLALWALARSTVVDD